MTETLPLQRFGAAVPGMPQSSLPHEQENAVTQPEHDDVERGAAEEQSGAPLTPTEEEAAKRPPSDDSGPGAGLDGGGRYGDDG